MNLQKIFDECHLISTTGGNIFKDGKFFSCVLFDDEATERERACRVLEEHFRVLANLEAMPKYAPNGLRKMQAVWYWVSTNFNQRLVLVELVEHCLANHTHWKGYDAFNFGGELSGYSDDIVFEAIQRGERFMTFGNNWERAANWAKAHKANELAQALLEAGKINKYSTRAATVKAHDSLVEAFWGIFKAQATRKEKYHAMKYAFN